MCMYFNNVGSLAILCFCVRKGNWTIQPLISVCFHQKHFLLFYFILFFLNAKFTNQMKLCVSFFTANYGRLPTRDSTSIHWQCNGLKRPGSSLRRYLDVYQHCQYGIHGWFYFAGIDNVENVYCNDCTEHYLFDRYRSKCLICVKKLVLTVADLHYFNR